MKPLETCQRLLTYISLCPAEENTTKWKKLIFKMLPAVIFGFLLVALFGSVLYFLKFMSSNLEKCLSALYQIAGSLGLVNSIIATFFMRQKLLVMIESLQKIYRSILDGESYQYLAQSNTWFEWAWDLSQKFMLVSVACTCIILPGASVLILKKQNKPYEFDSVFHTFYIILFWNRDTLLGYFFEICYNTVLVTIYILVSSIELLLFISVCRHHQIFYKIFRQSVRTLDSADKKQGEKLKILCELIQFHNSIKEWFLETTKFFSPFILIKMITFMIFLSSNVFQLDLQFRHFEFSIIIVILSCIISISNLLFYCLFGKLATESFLRIADCVYESNWQDLEIDSQKSLIVMIANAQIPMNYHGYGMIYLNLETFTNMLKTVFSYYMMFKTLTE